MKKTFNVKGMTCNACEMLIEDAIEDLNGVTSVKANQKKGIVEVDFDNLSETDIKKAIESEDFEVE